MVSQVLSKLDNFRLTNKHVPPALLGASDPSNLMKRQEFCPRCPLSGAAGDSRCKFLPSSTDLFDLNLGCSSCGCQKCPDGNRYYNIFDDYCKATPTTNCGPGPFCLQELCKIDPRCKSIRFDNDLIACGCACQECPDGRIYQGIDDYNSSIPLSAQDRQNCPDIISPITPPQDLCH